MTLIEMEGFLRGKCLPGDILVGETNAQYLLRKLNAATELQRQLTAREATVTNLEAQVQGLAAENGRLKSKGREIIKEAAYVYSHYNRMVDHLDGETIDGQTLHELQEVIEKETPNTDAELAEMRDEARAEGIYFTANRMLAAWDAGFIDSPAKEVIDVARMILSAAGMLKDATEGDFSRKFADEIMAEMAPGLRKEQGK